MNLFLLGCLFVVVLRFLIRFINAPTIKITNGAVLYAIGIIVLISMVGTAYLVTKWLFAILT